jgi:hypothetical protein
LFLIINGFGRHQKENESKFVTRKTIHNLSKAFFWKTFLSKTLHFLSSHVSDQEVFGDTQSELFKAFTLVRTNVGLNFALTSLRRENPFFVK